MKVAAVGDKQAKTLLYGLFLCLRYQLDRKILNHTVSFSMFMNSLSRVIKGLKSNIVSLNAQDVVQVFLRQQLEIVGVYEDENWIIKFEREYFEGCIPIPNCTSNKIIFQLYHIEDENYEFHLDIQYENSKQIETAFLVNCLALDYSLGYNSVTFENYTLPFGMALAAKLYECHGDMAGKLGTIDEALGA